MSVCGNYCSCGSGAVFVYLATALQQASGTRAMFFATDINPLAASVARNTATINSVPAFDLVRTDLLACYEQRLQVSRCNVGASLLLVQ